MPEHTTSLIKVDYTNKRQTTNLSAMIWTVKWLRGWVPKAMFNFAVLRTLRVILAATATSAFLFTSACSVNNAEDPAVTPATQQPPADQPDSPQEPDTTPEIPAVETGTFALVTTQPVAISEGGEAQQIPLSLTRTDGHDRPISLSVEAADAVSAKNLSFSLQKTTLGSAETTSSVSIELSIAIAPIMPHQRELAITASDGVNTDTMSVLLDIQPVQAPDVYLLVGQSNMEGFSKLDAKDASAGGLDESNPRILQLNVTGNDRQNFDILSDFTNPDKNVAFPRFVEAQDPLHESFNPSINGKKGTRIGLGLSFAKAALPNTTQNIVLVPAAWAGTGFCDNSLGELAWNPIPKPGNSSLGGSSLYDRAITRIDIALEESGGILRGILWHQGEADATSEQCSSVYDGNLKSLISSFRQDIRLDARGPQARGSQGTVPFVLGTMSRGDDARGEFSEFDVPKTEVDRVHRAVALEMNLTAVSNHDDLVPPAFNCGEGFCVHFGAGAYREMGARYYQRLLAIVSTE